jgi:ribosomal protein L6P/L9E
LKSRRRSALFKGFRGKAVKAKHGLYRALCQNMVQGVTKVFEKSLLINGVGYKVTMQGNKVVLGIGFSHPVEVVEPAGIKFECPTANEIVVKGIDKTAVGQCDASIRSIKRLNLTTVTASSTRVKLFFVKKAKLQVNKGAYYYD